MKNIDIQINKAKIISYEVDLKEDFPEVSATIGLFAGDKKISTFTLRTQSYYQDSIQFEIPLDLIEPIKDIASKLENILILKCSQSMGSLPAPKK